LETDERFLVRLSDCVESSKRIFQWFRLPPKDVIQTLAEKIGREISRNMVSENLEDLLDEIARFWEENHLGELEVLKSDSVTVVLKGCYKCQYMGDEAAASICSFGQAIVQTMIDSRLGRASRSIASERPEEPGVACSFELVEVHGSKAHQNETQGRL